MKITIKDCLTLPSFENAKVLASEEKIESVIKKISVLDANSVEDLSDYYIEKDQILITGFMGIRDDVETQCGIVEKLAEHNLTALVIYRVGDVVKDIDRKLIDLCNDKGIVLIATDPSRKVMLTEIIEEVTHILFYGFVDKYNSQLIPNSIYYLLNFDKYNDFPSAIYAAAEKNGFQMVLLSDDFHPVLVVENRFLTTVERAVRVGKEREMDKKATVCTMVDVDGTLTYWGPVTVQEKTYYMFIVDNEDLYSKDEIIKLANIIELAMGMWKYTPVDDQKAEFLKSLRRGNIRLAYYIKDDIDVDEKHIMSVYFGKGQEIDSVIKFIDEYCAEKSYRVIQLNDGNEVYGVVIGDGNNSDATRMFEEIESSYDADMFYVSGIDGIEGACEAFALINDTWKAARKVFPIRHTFSKYELVMISNCNTVQEVGGGVKRNYVKLLEAFDSENSKKGRQLLNTLETFVLDAGLNGIKTSEIMDVHINTVQYRLKKISEIMGIEISVNKLVPGVTMALALKRLDRDDGMNI